MLWLTLTFLSLLFGGWLMGSWLWRSRQLAGNQHSRDIYNLNHYQAEMQSLSKRLTSGEIRQDEFEQFKADLSLAMIEDIPSLSGHQSANAVSKQPIDLQSKPPALTVLLLMLILLIGGAFGLYQHLGAYNEIQLTHLLGQSAQRPLSETELTEVFSRIDLALERTPKNIELRFIAARMRFAKGDYQTAFSAFQQVVDQLPDESAQDKAMALGQMAQADFFMNEQQLSIAGREALQQAIALNPNERTALGLLGIDAFANGQYQEAIDYWRQLQSLVGSGANAAALENGVKKALERLQLTGKTVADRPTSHKKLEVQVTVAPKWAEQLQGTETLFVYAKLEGQPMPVAAKKIVQPQFPLTISLSDSDSPMPTVKLSHQQQVVVTARLSRSGHITPSVGDLEGHSQKVSLSQPQALPLIAIDLVPIR